MTLEKAMDDIGGYASSKSMASDESMMSSSFLLFVAAASNEPCST